MPKLTNCLWFAAEAEEAANFYTSVFPNSEIRTITRYTDASAKMANMPVGTVMTVAFSRDGSEFLALNGGPLFTFNESISFVIRCKDQAEIDHYWDCLTAFGTPGPCGWLTDRYGLSWQVVPENIEELMRNPEATNRVMAVLGTMTKLDLATLDRAYRGE
jgi:predicted 3-demethylubiquinone-9 3-methyltransferase (glyoxalase superfamily)